MARLAQACSNGRAINLLHLNNMRGCRREARSNGGLFEQSDEWARRVARLMFSAHLGLDGTKKDSRNQQPRIGEGGARVGFWFFTCCSSELVDHCHSYYTILTSIMMKSVLLFTLCLVVVWFRSVESAASLVATDVIGEVRCSPLWAYFAQ